VTEAEWLVSQDPDDLLDCARAHKRLNARKARLFACGCYRLVWDQMTYKDMRRTVQKAEERADRLITQRELEEYRYPGAHPAEDFANWLSLSLQSLAIANPNPAYVVWQVRVATENETYRHANRGIPCRMQAELVRCLVGNPHRPVAFDPSWQTSIAVGLARAMYESRAFDRMPILADALEEAGCDTADVLAHCRGPGPHVRGCWVVDLVLGKS
jgi:hypothetical protein